MEQAIARMPESMEWIRRILKRIEPHVRAGLPKTALDVGCAQGRGVIALTQCGYQTCGVEPWLPALEVAQELISLQKLAITVKHGSAESIPFADNSFSLVIATSVMEHVGDVSKALAEIHRVLCPGGVFWFNSASAMCPSQAEIDGFPLFGWYPDTIKRRIMLWAKANRPELIGNTDTPALHWWTPWKAERLLAQAGFIRVWNRWQLRDPSEIRGLAGPVMACARRATFLQVVGEILVPGCSYAAIKGDGKTDEKPLQR